MAEGGTQVSGVSGQNVAEILRQFDEDRPFLSEGGRTNRGLRSDIESLLSHLAELELQSKPDKVRDAVLVYWQALLVQAIKRYFNRQRLSFEFDPTKTTWELLKTLLDEARENGKEGPVAQYLVGAKLDLRFPDETVENHSYSTADIQTDRAGDFSLGDTVFHVTVAPQLPLFSKCLRNLKSGYRPYILVPSYREVGTRQLAEQEAPGQITIVTIETFVSQNIEEMAHFSGGKIHTGLRALLSRYNERVDQVEIDKSMMIEIPIHLK